MTETTPPVDLRPDHWAIVCDVLRQHVPDRKVLVFGSRATWTAKEYSDLDLAILGNDPMSLDTSSALAEGFSESDLPFKVDLVDWATINETFRDIIRRDGVDVQVPTRDLGVVVSLQRPMLKTGWRVSTWGEEIELRYGKALRRSDTRKGSYRVFGSNGPIGWTNEPLFPGPGVILGRKGAYRGVEYSAEPFYVIDTAYSVVSKAQHDMRWLYYAIAHYGLGKIDDGSPIPSTTRAAVYQRACAVPPLLEQRAIAQILGALDDKIELNRRMNETLEAMARALFKSWFVDFDPVRAKMEGRDPGLPPDLADLFPERLVDSDMGEIPEGWTKEPIYSFADVVYGAPFESKRFNIENLGVPLIRIRDLSTHAPSVSTQQIHSKGHLIEPGDIVVSMDGEFRVHVWKGPTAWLNQRVCHFEPKAGIPAAFVIEALREPLAFFERSKVGTTVIHLGKLDIDTFRIIQPNNVLLGTFAEVAQPLLDQTVSNALGSQMVAQVRDSLLPKFISGEIRICDVKRAAELVE